MRTYVIVTELEMDSLLKGDKGWEKSYQNEELIYQWRSKKNPDIVVKVFSSITKSGLGRKVGADAIRICAVNTKTNKGILKSKRVNRVEGWEDRVKARVIETIEKIW